MTVVDSDRMRETFEAYSDFGRTENDGLHRLALTPENGRVRDLFVEDLEALGLDVRVDRVGNVFGRREGTDPDAAPVLIGSHLDSQPYGGRFDGQLGVLAALETMRVLETQDIDTRRPVEIVNWTNEEGTRFKPALMGSGCYVGAHDVEETLAQTDGDGMTVREALAEIGYDGDAPVGPGEDPPSAFLELHIEQGPRLEDRGLEFGVVEGVKGMTWLEATVHGEADHAGPSPMHTRNDALVAAADVMTAVRRMAGRVADDVVTTVGELSVGPGSVNVIPDEARFTVDIRSYDDDAVAAGIDRVREELSAACDREGVEFDLETLWRIDHTEFAPRVRDAVAAAAEAGDHSYARLISGAGHDASYLNRVCDAGMIFVPSVDGKTHNEAELTEWSDVVAGTDAYVRAARTLADD